MSDRPRPTHLYVARLDCGCVIGLISDTSYEGKREAKHVGKSVAEEIARGRTVTRVPWKEYTEKIVHEPGFMFCLPEHWEERKVKANAGQLELL